MSFFKFKSLVLFIKIVTKLLLFRPFGTFSSGHKCFWLESSGFFVFLFCLIFFIYFYFFFVVKETHDSRLRTLFESTPPPK